MRRWFRVVWPLVIVGTWLALLAIGGDPRAALADLLRTLEGSRWFPVGLLVAFVARAVVLLPVTLLAALAGATLGPLWGLVVAAVGSTASSLVAYGLARALRSRGTGVRPIGARSVRGRLDRMGQRFREDAFTSTLIARLALVPGDLVNVVAGMSRVPWRPFAWATFLGGTPGLVAVVLAGASLEGSLDSGRLGVDVRVLAVSATFAVATGLAALWARRMSGARHVDVSSPGEPDRSPTPEERPPPR